VFSTAAAGPRSHRANFYKRNKGGGKYQSLEMGSASTIFEEDDDIGPSV